MVGADGAYSVRSLGHTMTCVAHDQVEAKALADRIVVPEIGKIALV